MRLASTSNLALDLCQTLTTQCESYRGLLEKISNPHLFSAVKCILDHRRDAARQLSAQTTNDKDGFHPAAIEQLPVESELISAMMRGEGVFLLALIEAETDLLERYSALLENSDLQPDFRAALNRQYKVAELNIRYLQIEQQQAA